MAVDDFLWNIVRGESSPDAIAVAEAGMAQYSLDSPEDIADVDEAAERLSREYRTWEAMREEGVVRFVRPDETFFCLARADRIGRIEQFFQGGLAPAQQMEILILIANCRKSVRWRQEHPDAANPYREKYNDVLHVLSGMCVGLSRLPEVSAQRMLDELEKRELVTGSRSEVFRILAEIVAEDRSVSAV